MTRRLKAPFSRATHRAALGGIVLLALGCTDDRLGPDTEAPQPTAAAADSALDQAAAVLDNRSSRPGIAFGTWNMESQYLGSVHTGWVQGGPLDPSNIVSKLSEARAKGGRVVVKLCKGSDHFVKNGDGTFSLTKWKALVSAYRSANLGPYISDGTIIGHMLIDEPHRADRWGGRIISHATLEEMAKFSKQLWPTMPVLVRAMPTWLAATSVNYQHLDAGWLQFAAPMGSPSSKVNAEANAAKQKGLGMLVGLNVLDGGDGSSRIAGTLRGRYVMTASELRSYGSALLAHSHACAFFSWQHRASYYDRSDIRSAMAELSNKAKGHAKTACRQ